MAKGENRVLSEIRNRKASRDYFIGETFEAGIVLTGTEIKSLRSGRAQIDDAFVRIENGEAHLYQAHIPEYDFGNRANHVPTRTRKLLLHKREILKLKGASDVGGTAIVPLKLYFKGALAKRLIAVCTGKKLYDKREALKKKEDLRAMQRAANARAHR